MKVLLITKFFPPVRGGIEAMTYELAEGLNQHDIQADVLCANTGPATVRETSASGYSVTRSGSLGMLLSTSLAPRMVLDLRRLADGYDIVHVELPDPLANLAIWCVRPSAPVVLRWHSDIVAQPRALKIYAPLQNWLLQRAAAITATSAPYAVASPWLAPHRQKLHIVPLGIRDLPGNDPAAAAIRDQYPGRRLVFSLGRMTYYKGFGTLIDAATSMPEDCMVLIGGGGELLEGYRRKVQERQLHHRIRFLGPLSDEQMPAYMRACDVFCLPSIARSEAFGVVLLEAMAASRPIVTTKIPGSGVPWVSPDGVCGLTVPVDDPNALSGALRQLLDDPHAARMYGKAARQRYLDHFTADRMVANTIHLFKGLRP